MKTEIPYAPDYTPDQSSMKETAQRYSVDIKLRQKGCLIEGRPKDGPTLWKLSDGRIMTEAQACKEMGIA